MSDLLKEELSVAPSNISNTSSSFSSLSCLRLWRESFSLKLCSTESQELCGFSSFLLFMICFNTGDTFVMFRTFLVDLQHTVISKEKILHAVEWKVCDGIYLGLKIVVFEVSIFRFSLLFLISAFRALNARVS